MIAVIKTEGQYEEVLGRVVELAKNDPAPNSEEGRELELLAVLLRDYERRVFPLPPPSPLAAIRLRMDQLSLAPKDLVPFLGSRSKVSEVLSAKRPLSLAMIRSLHAGLAIPLESLVSDEVDEPVEDGIEWDRFPVREMAKLGWVSQGPSKNRLDYSAIKSVMEEFFKPVGGPTALGVLHKTDRVRTAKTSDRYALAAWAGRVRKCADAFELKGTYQRADWDTERLRELRNLSRFDVGPRLAMQYLTERGIVVVLAPHLKRTRLDGAALVRGDGAPVIGLTLRHDRVDNFWFTLFHELMHVLFHLTAALKKTLSQPLFLDDLDMSPEGLELEKDADERAREALVPEAAWNGSAVRFVVAPATVSRLALEVGVHEAIVAGRVRYETQNFRLLSSMVGAGAVRSQFPDIHWPTDAS